MQVLIVIGMIALSVWNVALTGKIDKQDQVIKAQTETIQTQSKVNAKQEKDLKYHEDILNLHHGVLEGQQEVNDHLNYNVEYTYKELNELEKKAITTESDVRIKKK